MSHIQLDPNRTHLTRNRDILKNLSHFEGRCRCCDTVISECTEAERASGWIECECGHVYQLENKWRWQ